MPINRLQQAPSFPRIGKLRKGAPKPETGNKPGADLGKHFRFVADDPLVQADFTKAFGDKPEVITFMFPPHGHINEVFVAWYEHHVASRLLKRCDGDTQAQWFNEAKRGYSFEPKPCDNPAPGEPCKACRTTAHIKIWIPELLRRAFVEVPFSSTWDVVHLQQYLSAFAMVNGGTLNGIPFILSRRETMVAHVDKDGNSKRMKKFLLHVEPHPAWEAQQVKGILADLGKTPQLEAPKGVIVTDDDDIEDDAGDDQGQDDSTALATAIEGYKAAARAAADRGIDLNGSTAKTGDDAAEIARKTDAIKAKVSEFDKAVDSKLKQR
jgi:hypothetical protein